MLGVEEIRSLRSKTQFYCLLQCRFMGRIWLALCQLWNIFMLANIADPQYLEMFIYLTRDLPDSPDR